ncbi:Molybdenum-pterin-binding protein 2 [Acidithiobacillus ferrivorans]|uniref:Molybdenum-pterin-binding protein 2 n=1 Tax=Acidithiobacillus ferrivorans TaxID=160808 RepID=A0A060UL94_9PROT|nr:TOBE domain-containing protein [Acidithiobacillus ferrivorans]CDQ09121.1 Molybdenum-pterin-binding protein 2 [Acidithiobacillus ferrivorans]SMH65324.1 Molybdenum-pterin-binding protein 2 [Acidithiobacillus ferrivorans]
MKTSLRNHLKGKIVNIIRGQVVSEIEIETAAGTVASMITTHSLDHLEFKVGDSALAVVKATEVGVEKP